MQSSGDLSGAVRLLFSGVRYRHAGVAVLAALFLFGMVSLPAQQPDGQQYPPGMASAIIQWLVVNPESAMAYKQSLFAGVRRSVARRIAMTTTNKAERALFMLLYDSRSSVPDNLTDEQLGLITEDMRLLKKRASKACLRATSLEVRALEHYPPEQVAALYQVITTPWFDIGEKPYGAYTTTWASWSLHSAYQEAGKAMLARRSVVLRLLAEEGKIFIPTSVNIDFVWSGRPSVTMDLDFVHWRRVDVARLKRLLGNPYYAEAAQKQIDLILQR